MRNLSGDGPARQGAGLLSPFVRKGQTSSARESSGVQIPLPALRIPFSSDEALRDAIHRLFLPEDFSLLQVIAGDTLGMGAFCLVFLIGTLLAFLSPVGAFLQIFGILGFALSVGTYDPVMYPSSWDAVDGWSLGLGYALGVVSTMIVMQSPVRAMLAANGGKPVRMLGRFAALSPQTISSWR
jgi:hypothetical protein